MKERGTKRNFKINILKQAWWHTQSSIQEAKEGGLHKCEVSQDNNSKSPVPPKKKRERERKGERDRGRGEPEMGLKKVRDLKRLVLFKKAGIWGDGDRCERS